ncbi:hypothetical protein GLAREA_02526 [Glarea lozoyensis ATCC 20868]|uniref:2EXR domain-containing protein n=1 Tax=Glarea lozoyensis (strain ATCC 20868 / MF5171) TaxID=1116229 RepID=S3DJ87_GLAL2|nr:uncharacterized protein GLAREA_02526 [Glarea lozoyensis ATCC 20868]EPE26613.1 hypothetical protein GLAREA_02526 [Glarea lozoyensis ATCC 20868]
MASDGTDLGRKDLVTGWHAYYPDVAPPMTFVCREAREEVKKQYKALHGNDGSPAIWFNPKTDIIAFRNRNDRYSRAPSVPNEVCRELCITRKITKVFVEQGVNIWLDSFLGAEEIFIGLSGLPLNFEKRDIPYVRYSLKLWEHQAEAERVAHDLGAPISTDLLEWRSEWEFGLGKLRIVKHKILAAIEIQKGLGQLDFTVPTVRIVRVVPG